MADNETNSGVPGNATEDPMPETQPSGVVETVDFESDKPNFGDPMASILARKRARTVSVKIQLDGEVAADIELLKEELAEARRQDLRDKRTKGMDWAESAPRIEQKLTELTNYSQETVATFTFRSIGRSAFERLVRSHKPDQHDKKEGSIWNTRTFPPALIAESSHQPKITYEQATEVMESPDWNHSEVLKLFNAALSANSESPDIPLSNNDSARTVDIA